MKRMIYCGALAALLTGNIAMAQQPEPAQAEQPPQEEYIVTRRRASDADKKRFVAAKAEAVKLSKRIFYARSNPTTQDLMKFSVEMRKLSPPDDIAQHVAELHQIADALRISTKISPSGRYAITNVPADCMALPRCTNCLGHGRVPSESPSLKLTQCGSCSGSGVGKSEPAFDRTLALEVLQMRVQKIYAWLNIVEVPDYIIEKRKVEM